MVVNEEVSMLVTREIDVEATPEEVWEALATDEGRERWLDEPDRDVQVEVVEEPERLVWWWYEGEEPWTRVEFLLVPTPPGTRVVVTETVPSFPLAMLATGLNRVCA
jgi:uncharacterized protein YndB with AHSA1/START domain